MSQENPTKNICLEYGDSIQAKAELKFSNRGLGGESIVEMIRTRAETGKEEYGTYLAADNGRDPMQDLVEELVDASCYLTQVSQEDCVKMFGHLGPNQRAAVALALPNIDTQLTLLTVAVEQVRMMVNGTGITEEEAGHFLLQAKAKFTTEGLDNA